MEETTIADVLKDAIGASHDHWKIGREKIFQAQNVLEMLIRATDNRDLFIAIAGSLALLVTLIAIMVFISNISGCMQKIKSCFQSAYAKLGDIWSMMRNIPQQLLNLIKPQINKEYVKKEIQASIVNFKSVKEQLTLLKLKKVNRKDVNDIKAAIKTVWSIEEHLKGTKSQEINEEEVKEIEAIMQPAIKAVESMGKIINKGVWLIGRI